MAESTEQHQTPHFLLSHEGELHGEDTADNRELVRRIQACVHACEGISTDELERGIVADMRRVLENVAPLLKAQNAVLKSRKEAA